ncbi:hypothetical protein [Pseudomonas iridis]|uniref:hypothetical protein n=1 Tax=Pseudomonas iridis TaxID=2710587 RepID=UPI001B34003E|nr:hypothetical protein [Pseudomonas iridis]MBP5969441.1 hypothetical protein [Pseudomonas iridis]
MSLTRSQIINSMCMTMRHDFGLRKPEGESLSARIASGMTEDEQSALLRDMTKLYSHHIAPILDELEKAREIAGEFASLAERWREKAVARAASPAQLEAGLMALARCIGPDTTNSVLAAMKGMPQ